MGARGVINPQYGRKESILATAEEDAADDDSLYKDIAPTPVVGTDYDLASSRQRQESAAINTGYDSTDSFAADAAPIYATASGSDMAKILNANAPMNPLYNMTSEEDGTIYGKGKVQPGWGYLDITPDEDLYGGLADVFYDSW